MKKTSLNITDETIIRRNPEVQFSRIDNEIVLMTPDSTNYIKMNETSTGIWNLLKEDRTFKDLVKLLIETFDVSQEKCRQDTKEFIENASSLKLIELNKTLDASDI